MKRVVRLGFLVTLVFMTHCFDLFHNSLNEITMQFEKTPRSLNGMKYEDGARGRHYIISRLSARKSYSWEQLCFNVDH